MIDGVLIFAHLSVFYENSFFERQEIELSRQVHVKNALSLNSSILQLVINAKDAGNILFERLKCISYVLYFIR